jgi:hypothetical protein
MRIANLAEGSAFTRSLAVRHVSNTLLTYLAKEKLEHEPHIVLLELAGRCITAQWIEIYGKKYICNLTSSPGGIMSSNTLQVLPLRGIKFAMGLYGIRALKFSHEDGSESNWLGSIASSWI